MDSFEINKILGAVLGTCLVLLAVHIAAGALFAPRVPGKPGYEIAVKEEQPAKTAAAPAAQSFDNLLASASAEHGAQIAKQCQVCHNLQEGQGPKIGPDLYGVVDRPVASLSNFHYTDALKKKGGKWTFAALNNWLEDPRADVPGTAMTFAGLKDHKQRADVIAYLDTLSKNPVPLPTPKKEVEATKEEQPAKTVAAPAAQSFDNLLANASVQRGAEIAKQCQICHNLQEGKGPKIGPDLYGVVGRSVASVPNFHYTDALKKKGGTWTLEALNKWLEDPRADVPGTAMTFAGIKNEKQRADLVAYLDTLSKSPVPLPKKQGEANTGSGTAATPGKEAAPPKAPETAPAAPSAQQGKSDSSTPSKTE